MSLQQRITETLLVVLTGYPGVEERLLCERLHDDKVVNSPETLVQDIVCHHLGHILDKDTHKRLGFPIDGLCTALSNFRVINSVAHVVC